MSRDKTCWWLPISFLFALFIVIFSITSCIRCSECHMPLYNEGDIVYLKPDSTIGVIDQIQTNDEYIIIINHKGYYYKQTEIFGKK